MTATYLKLRFATQ